MIAAARSGQLLLAVALTSMTTVPAIAQPTPVAYTAPTGVISPAVVASWFAERVGASEQLRLLVLWRGTPGWFMRGGRISSRDGGTRHQTTIEYGSLILTSDFDRAKRSVAINGTAVSLGDHNVVFVDDVDLASGPRVTGTLQIEQRMPGSGGQIGIVLQRYPQLLSFLRCESTGTDESKQAYLARLCLDNVGVVP